MKVIEIDRPALIFSPVCEFLSTNWKLIIDNSTTFFFDIFEIVPSCMCIQLYNCKKEINLFLIFFTEKQFKYKIFHFKRLLFLFGK